MLDETDLLWNNTPGEEPELAIPRARVAGVLSLAHSNYGLSGVPRTLMLVRSSANGRP